MLKYSVCHISFFPFYCFCFVLPAAAHTDVSLCTVTLHVLRQQCNNFLLRIITELLKALGELARDFIEGPGVPEKRSVNVGRVDPETIKAVLHLLHRIKDEGVIRQDAYTFRGRT